MTTLHIEHAITDFPTWKAAFDRAEPYRIEAGVLGHTVRQPEDDAQYVVIDLEFEDAAAARGFLEVLETRIWSSRESSPALAGRPTASILVRVA